MSPAQDHILIALRSQPGVNPVSEDEMTLVVHPNYTLD
jgi:hypothetical protein